ncbi:uncharacterized protein TNCT_491231 [Trichonephila clavata]|uniref:Uncharacterized protein n=1 Tax=Trichonephila clavata TaxID=2740835 RepID=A0A8X6LXF0_TRICU|nr:uncharacterized protein TNCT_491231 [Trichonephila clavata]
MDIVRRTFFILTVLASAHAAGIFLNDEANEKGNAYIDKLLRDIIDVRGDEFDPYTLGESGFGFYKKLLFVNISGEVKLHKGHMRGLRTLHRTDDSHLTKNNEKLYIRAYLGAGALDFEYEGSVKFLNYGPGITVQGHLAYIEIIMDFSVNANTGKDGDLLEFFIDDIRGMDVWVSGLGPLNWALNPIIRGAKSLFKTYLTGVLENKIQTYIQERLPNFQFPVEGLHSI